MYSPNDYSTVTLKINSNERWRRDLRGRRTPLHCVRGLPVPRRLRRQSRRRPRLRCGEDGHVGRLHSRPCQGRESVPGEELPSLLQERRENERANLDDFDSQSIKSIISNQRKSLIDVLIFRAVGGSLRFRFFFTLVRCQLWVGFQKESCRESKRNLRSSTLCSIFASSNIYRHHKPIQNEVPSL